ncbi:MAG TPA: L,D-transpeptidase [Vicinamibacteria bacterium]
MKPGSIARRIVRFFGHGGGVAWYLLAVAFALTAASTALFANTVGVRFRRDVTRAVFEDNQELLDNVKAYVEVTGKMLRDQIASAPATPREQPYIVVSIDENRLWYKKGGDVLFEARVATGSGKTMINEGGNSAWKFDTPRGRLEVQSKEEDPAWTPPDWHYVEEARKRGLGLAHLDHGGAIHASDGGTITVAGENVVKRYPDGSQQVLGADEGREIVVDGKIVVPPSGTNQRKYKGVLGTHRLNLGNGYALHGTNNPASIGHSVSHGCVRLLNQDIAKLYQMVPVRTPVYIY